MDVSFVEYLRPEERFADIEGLIAQMHADCGRAREILAAPDYAPTRFEAGVPAPAREEPLP